MSLRRFYFHSDLFNSASQVKYERYEIYLKKEISEICTIVLGIFAPTVEMWFGLFFFSSNFQIATITKIHTSTRLLFWQNNVIIPVDSVPEKSLL